VFRGANHWISDHNRIAIVLTTFESERALATAEHAGSAQQGGGPKASSPGREAGENQGKMYSPGGA